MPIESVASTPVRLTDQQLTARLLQLARDERQATVALVAHLAEFDARRLYLGLGHGSLFAYCTAALRLSEHGALNRIEAARLARRFPVVLEMLAEGALTLATLRLVGPHLTDETHRAVIERARGRSKREVAILCAELRPQPDVPATIRKLPAPPHTPTGPAVRVVAGALTPPAEGAAAPTEPTPAARPGATPRSGIVTPRAVVAPLAPERFRLQLTMDQETHDSLRILQDLLRREIPDGDPAAIVGRALALLRREVERKKTAAVMRPKDDATRAGSAPEPVRIRRRPRKPLAAATRAVWHRDRGQCTFVAPDGTRCAARTFLEIHHLEPYGVGGETIVANLTLRCHPHHALEGERDFGPRDTRLAPGRVAI